MGQNDGHMARYVMHFLGSDRLSELVRDKSDEGLRLSHLGLVLLLLQEVNPNTGRINVQPSKWAARMGLNRTQVSSYISLLIKRQLFAKGVDPKTDEPFLMPHPYLWACGGPQKRGWLWLQFNELHDHKARLGPSHEEGLQDYNAAEAAQKDTFRRRGAGHLRRLAEIRRERREQYGHDGPIPLSTTAKQQ